MFVISRIGQYKFSDCAAIYSEAERKLANYDNPNWQPEKVKDNIYLIVPSIDKGIEQYILDKKKELRCRLSTDPSLPKEKQTNCFCQALFTASPAFMESLTEDQKCEFFQLCLSFFTTKFPSVEIISAIRHEDESTSHLHINFLPLCTKCTNKGKLKTVFSSSELFKGKDFFTLYQDEFFAFMKEHYPDMPLERKGEEHRDHLPPKDFRILQSEIQKAKEELVEIQQLKEEVSKDMTPLLNAKIANADLRRQKEQLEKENKQLKSYLDSYNWFLRFVLSKFPALKPLVDKFYAGDQSKERGKFERV